MEAFFLMAVHYFLAFLDCQSSFDHKTQMRGKETPRHLFVIRENFVAVVILFKIICRDEKSE